VDSATPVERHAIPLRRTVPASVVALDAEAIDGLMHFRADQAASPIAETFAPLAAERPVVELPPLPSATSAVTIVPDVQIDAGGDPAPLDAATIEAGIAVLDGNGLVHRFTGADVPLADGSNGITINLEGVDEPRLASIDVNATLPPGIGSDDATISVAALSALSPGSTAPQPIGLAPDAWRTAASYASDSTATRVGASMQPTSVGNLAVADVPAVVNPALLEQMALAAGDSFEMNLAGADMSVRISSVVESFPTTDSATPLVVVDLPTVALLRLRAAHDESINAANVTETHQPDEWWLDLGDGDPDEVSRLLSAPPFLSPEVVTVTGRLRTLISDPVAVGIIGALGLGAIAAALFALIGLVVAASVSARQRQSEFALLRALGLSRGQLTGWLWLENGSLALVSVIAGVGLGAVISLAVLPNVTVTGDGLPPSPPVLVTLPLATIAALALVALIALVVVLLVTAAVLRRMGIGNILRLGEE
jgi:hypothetical protein